MTTTNGQAATDHPVAAAQPHSADRATSTVLALDGWGPAERPTPAPENGNSADHSAAPVVAPEDAPDSGAVPVADTSAPRARRLRQLQMPQMRGGMRLLAPALAVGLTLGVGVGGAIRFWQARPTVSAAPAAPKRLPSARDRVADGRRRIAILIDPTLAPPPPPQSRIQRLRAINWTPPALRR